MIDVIPRTQFECCPAAFCFCSHVGVSRVHAIEEQVLAIPDDEVANWMLLLNHTLEIDGPPKSRMCLECGKAHEGLLVPRSQARNERFTLKSLQCKTKKPGGTSVQRRPRRGNITWSGFRHHRGCRHARQHRHPSPLRLLSGGTPAAWKVCFSDDQT
jgi:hypothetical protein